MFLANSPLVSASLGASVSFPGSSYEVISASQILKKILATKKILIQLL